MKKSCLFIILITFLNLHGLTQNISRLDSMFLARIPFDSTMAKQDLENGVVRLLDIFSPTWASTGIRFDEMIESYQLDSIERLFGFKNELIVIDSILPKYTEQRETEYNNIVIQYLDSVNNIDFRAEYESQILNAFRSNRNHCGAMLSDIELPIDSASNTTSSFTDNHRKIGHITKSKYPVEIRYYYTPSLANGGSVTIIKCVDGRLEAEKVNYWFNVNKPYDKRRINRTEIIELMPVDSWVSFLDSLHNMNFFSFPSMEVIRPRMKKYMQLADGRTVEKRSMITDGADYTYQIKIDDRVRTFYYHSPISWYQVYDHVEELKIADDIRNHFVMNLKPK